MALKIEDVKKTLRDMDALLMRGLMLVNEGDRVPVYLRGTMTFTTGENENQDIVFNIPADAHYYASRLNLYLGKRIVSEDNPVTGTDLTYRPADWTTTADYQRQRIKDANAQIEIRDADGKYQKEPISVALTFSTRYGVPVSFDGGGTLDEMPVSSYIGGLDFHVPYKLRRGTTMTINVVPNFSRIVTTAEKEEFRVMGVLTGFKKVRAFK